MGGVRARCSGRMFAVEFVVVLAVGVGVAVHSLGLAFQRAVTVRI